MSDQADHSSASPAAKLSLVQTISSPVISGSPAWSLSFTPDAKYLAVCFGCPNTCVKIWRRVTHQRANEDSIGQPNTNVTNDNSKVGNGSDNEEWRPFAIIEGHTRSIRDVEFAPISSSSTLILATASFDGMVMIWEGDVSQFDDMHDSTYNSDMGSDDGNRFEECTFEAIAQLEGHENEVKHVTWNQTGSLLASCGRDKTIWVWECFLPGTVGGMAPNDANNMQDDGDFECLAVLQGHDGELFPFVQNDMNV